MSLLSIGLMALGMLSVIYQDFAYEWLPVPSFHPGRKTLAVICGLFMIAASVTLLISTTAAKSARALFLFLLAWLCLKIPALIVAPKIEGVWLGFGEIGMLLAGGWMLFAELSGLERAPFFSRITGHTGIHIAQILFGLAVIPVGLGHIFYIRITAGLIPSWMPFRLELAYLTGLAQILCGLAILLSIFPRVAARIETTMLFLFAFLVWGPQSWLGAAPNLPGSAPGPRFPLTAFLITWVIAASAWLVAASTSQAREQLDREIA